MEPTSSLTERILDTAAEIVIGDGVRALGPGTVAQRLGVSRATIEAAFGSFEDLVSALLAREARAVVRLVADNVERDPRGGLLSRIVGYSLSAVYEHPLARALHVSEPASIAHIARSLEGVAAVPELSLHPHLVARLQAVGMVRADVDPADVTALIDAVGSGVALTAPRGRLDEVATALVLMLERAVDADVVDTSPGKSVVAHFVDALVASDTPR